MDSFAYFLNSQEGINDIGHISDEDKNNFASLIKGRRINRSVSVRYLRTRKAFYTFKSMRNRVARFQRLGIMIRLIDRSS